MGAGEAELARRKAGRRTAPVSGADAVAAGGAATIDMATGVPAIIVPGPLKCKAEQDDDTARKAGTGEPKHGGPGPGEAAASKQPALPRSRWSGMGGDLVPWRALPACVLGLAGAPASAARDAEAHSGATT